LELSSMLFDRTDWIDDGTVKRKLVKSCIFVKEG